MNHTFLTYLVAYSQDLGLAAKVAGHCDLKMLRKYYDGVATRKSGEVFFGELVSDNEPEVTDIPISDFSDSKKKIEWKNIVELEDIK